MKAGNDVWIPTSEILPPERTYVLVRHTLGTWIDCDDQENVNCVVVRLVYGISEDTRQKMKSGELPDPPYNGKTRSHFYSFADESESNRTPYRWEAFGSMNFSGKDISHWMSIPSAPEAAK